MKIGAFIFSAIPLIINEFAQKYMEGDKRVTLDELKGNYGLHANQEL